MTTARRRLVDPAVTRWYHCISRCVRQADTVRSELEQHGIRCWDARNIGMPNASLESELALAISRSRFMLLLLSASTHASQWVSSEVRWAIEHDVKVLVVRLDAVPPEVNLAFLLANAHWVDVSATSLDDSLPKLRATVHRAVFGPSGFQGIVGMEGVERTPELAMKWNGQGSSTRSHDQTVGVWDAETTAATPKVPSRSHRADLADDAFSSHTIVIRYPAPIAMAYRRFVRQPDAGIRFRRHSFQTPIFFVLNQDCRGVQLESPAAAARVR